MINELNIKSALGTLNEQDLSALNTRLGKDVSTAPDAVAPVDPQQDAAANNTNLDQAPVQTQATPAAAPRQSASTGRNPFSQ